MTKEQADTIIALLTNIRDQITRTANATAKDNSFVFYSDPATAFAQTFHVKPPHITSTGD